MPIIKSAIKRMHQASKRRARNIGTKRELKAAVKAFIADKTAANLSKAQSCVDTAVKKNILKKNTASRKKSQLANMAKEAGVKITAKAEAPKEAKKVEKPAAKKAPAKKPAAKAKKEA